MPYVFRGLKQRQSKNESPLQFSSGLSFGSMFLGFVWHPLSFSERGPGGEATRQNKPYFINTGRIRFSNVKISSHFSWVKSPRSVTAMSCTDLPVFNASLAISAEAS